MKTQDLSTAEGCINEKIRRTEMILIWAGPIYPLWTFVHQSTSDYEIHDPFISRLGVYISFLLLIVISRMIKAEPKVKLTIMQSARWITVTHYFMIVANNGVSAQYAICAYFIVIAMSLLFEEKKYLAVFSAYVVFLSLVCGEGPEHIPGYMFQLGIATNLLFAYLTLSNKQKILDNDLKSSMGWVISISFIFVNLIFGFATASIKAGSPI